MVSRRKNHTAFSGHNNIRGIRVKQQGSSLFRVHTVYFHDKIQSEVHLNIHVCSRHKKQTTFLVDLTSLIGDCNALYLLPDTYYNASRVRN